MNFEMFCKISFICVSLAALVELIIMSNMNFNMFYKILLMFVGFAASVALE